MTPMPKFQSVTARELSEILGVTYDRVRTLRKNQVIEPIYALGSHPYRFDAEAAIQAVRDYRSPAGSVKTESAKSRGKQTFSRGLRGRKKLCLP